MAPWLDCLLSDLVEAKSVGLQIFMYFPCNILLENKGVLTIKCTQHYRMPLSADSVFVSVVVMKLTKCYLEEDV